MSAHPAEIFFPHCVGSGLVILPEMEDREAAKLARRKRAAKERWLRVKQLRLGLPVDPAVQREIDLAMNWVSTGPHPSGALKHFCLEQKLYYPRFYKRIELEHRRLRQEAEKQ